ncbi:YecA family protein [Paraburkholderia youngii]|uniref:YecA family protein n=1 Tax=Paraburkholderia youngii TaxID=2782701 RepID=UPI003D221F7A
MIGTQTVFVLDASTCLILTHLEYAQDPETPNLTVPRTHARYRGQSLVRTDAFIRKRKLSRDEVITINHLLKSRARRYVAAANKEWLYPERSFCGEWKDIAQVLLPQHELWRFGGEIYVGHADGSTQYQDAFGRTSGAHKYLQRERRATDHGPNNFCGCGSGRKFKHCCKDLLESDRPSWDVYGIRERNLMFCNAVKGILGLTAGKGWDDVRRELSDEQVKRIHEAFGSLWPEDTDLVELVPRPRRGAFRAVYLGASDPRTAEATVLGWLPYFDEVVLAHPFINPFGMKPDFSPTKSPSQYKAQTLKNVLLLLTLEPYIRSGYVHLIPDPGDFNPHFGMSALQMAKERTAGWKAAQGSVDALKALAKDDHGRFLRRLPESSLRGLIRECKPEASDAQIDAAIAYMKSSLAAAPYALLVLCRIPRTTRHA